MRDADARQDHTAEEAERVIRSASRIADAESEPALQRQLLRQMLTDLSDAVLTGRCPSPRQCADVAVAMIVRTSRSASIRR